MVLSWYGPSTVRPVVFWRVGFNKPIINIALMGPTNQEAEPEPAERRQSRRYPVDLEAEYRLLDALGTWQSIALVDTNVDNPRRSVRLSFLPG